MGLFDFLKNKDKEQPSAPTFPAVLGAPCKGSFVPMDQVPDEVFSQGIMGACCGIEPAEGRVYAPVDGTISQVTDTMHALGIEACGMEILIHVGVDTVDMNGRGFTNAVKEGQAVKKGELLMTMDLNEIKAANHPATVIMAVTNSDDFASVEPMGSGAVEPGSDVLRVSK